MYDEGFSFPVGKYIHAGWKVSRRFPVVDVGLYLCAVLLLYRSTELMEITFIIRFTFVAACQLKI